MQNVSEPIMIPRMQMYCVRCGSVLYEELRDKEEGFVDGFVVYHHNWRDELRHGCPNDDKHWRIPVAQLAALVGPVEEIDQ